VGDLWLLGRPLCGHVTGKNGAHALNHELAAAVRRAFAAERRPRPSRSRVLPAGTMVAGGSLSPRPGIAAL
jgi:UDP-3-O-acyl-N-acetylglucosamine deacetylase